MVLEAGFEEDSNEKGAGVGGSQSGDVAQPWRVLISKRRTCLSEEPVRTVGGMAILNQKGRHQKESSELQGVGELTHPLV